jgi:hypothetical protein
MRSVFLIVLLAAMLLCTAECASKIRPKRAVHASSSSSTSDSGYSSYDTNYVTSASSVPNPYDVPSPDSSSTSGYSAYYSNYGPTSDDPYSTGSTISSEAGSGSWDSSQTGDHRPRKWPRVGNSTAVDFWAYDSETSSDARALLCTLATSAAVVLLMAF